MTTNAICRDCDTAWYTPLGEPMTSCFLCGETGVWGCVQIGVGYSGLSVRPDKCWAGIGVYGSCGALVDPADDVGLCIQHRRIILPELVSA